MPGAPRRAVAPRRRDGMGSGRDCQEGNVVVPSCRLLAGAAEGQGAADVDVEAGGEAEVDQGAHGRPNEASGLTAAPGSVNGPRMRSGGSSDSFIDPSAFAQQWP